MASLEPKWFFCPGEISLIVTIFIQLSLKALGVAIVIDRYAIIGCCSQSQWLHFLNNNSKNNNKNNFIQIAPKHKITKCFTV